MVFRHQSGRPRPSSEPPSLQSPRCGTPRTPSDESKDKKWFRGVFKRKGGHPKVWATTSLGGVGDMLPPPPPSPSPPPSQQELDGVEQEIQDVNSDPVGDTVTNRCEMKNSHQDSGPPAVPSEEGEPISDAVGGDARIPDGHASRDFACGAVRREENHDRAKASDAGVRRDVMGPTAAKRTSELQEQPYSGSHAALRAAATTEKFGAKGEAVLPQRASSQTLERRSTRIDSGIADAPVKLILPLRLSVEAADEPGEEGGEIVRMEVGDVEVTTKRSGDARHSGTNPEASTRVALPGNTGPLKKAVTVGMSVLCLEMRSSAASVSAIRRWKEAEIAEVYPEESNAAFAKVLFWDAETGSESLRLKEHWDRLAIPGSLTREEMDTGAPLEGDALAMSRKVFKPRSRNRGRPRGSDERRREKLSPSSHRRSTSVPLSRVDGGTSAGPRRTLTLGASESFEDMQKQVAAGSVAITRRRSGESGAASSPARAMSGVVRAPERGQAASGGNSKTALSKSPRRYSTPPSRAHEHSRRSSTGRMASSMRSPLRYRDSRKGSGGSSLAGSKASVRRTESDASGRSGSSSRRRWQLEEERRSSTSARHLMAGDRIDCLDYYVSNQTGQERCEWREAEVLKVECKRRPDGEPEIRVRVHFLTWSSKWDTWISWDREQERFAPHLSKARPASERLRADGPAVNQGLSSAQSSYPPRGRTGSNSTASTATPTVTTASSSSTSGGEMGRSNSRGYLSDGPGEASTRNRRASSRSQGDRTAQGDPSVPQRKSGVRRPRSPGGRLTVTGDVMSAGSSTVTSGGCSNSPATSEVDSMGSSESLFREAMRRKGLAVVDVEPDGNCLFRSVSHQIYGDADKHNQVRKACVDHMSKHKARFGVFVAEDFRDYLYKIRQSGVWGDDLEIRALEELFDRPIEIYSSDAEDLRPMKIDFDASELDLDATPIKLSYHGQSHYNSVRDKTLSYPLHPLRTKNILHIRQAQHARTPRSASVSRAGGGRAGEGPGSEAFVRRSARRSRFRGLRGSSPFSHGASKKAGSAFRNIIAGFSSKIM